MKKIMRYLKPFRLSILAVVVLLFIQAFSDLSLPQYTSDIVDVGIQQGGIENSALEAIRVSTYEKMQYFMSSEDAQYMLEHYKYVGKDSVSESEYNKYKKDYPILETEDIYVRDTSKKDTVNKLSAIIEKPLFIAAMFDGSISMSADSDASGDTAQQGDSSSMSFLPEELQGQDIFAMLSMMTEEQIAEFNQQLDATLEKMPSMILEQSAVVVVKQEYKAIGIDVNQIQNRYIFIAGAKMLALALVGMMAAIIVGYLASRIAAGASRNIRKDVFGKVVSFSNAEFDKFSTASLITRSTNDIQQVQMLLVMMLRMVLYAPIVGIGGIIKVTNTKTNMGWIIVVAVCAIFLLVGILMIIAMPKFKSMQKLVDRLNLVTREILTGLPVIRAFSREKHEEKRFDIANKDLTRTNLFVNRTMTFMMPTMMFVMNGISLMIIWFGGKGINAGNLQVGDMMAFLSYTMQIVMAFLMLSMLSIMLPRATVSANRIMEVMDTDSMILDPKNKKTFTQDKKGVVEFRHMSFRYPHAEEDVLVDINFTAKPGETTAIIGSTGSGKSTLINLIPRLYDATEGEVLVDGVNVKEVSQHDLREKIGFVPQKGVLFSGTIDSNLRYGKQNASEEEVKRAARIAQAQDFIEEKPEQYKESIAQGGSNVSGGQKQRLSIARAIAKDPEIYVFDDSFSALDFKTDATLRKALKEEISDSTIIIVAQRISTILHAEQILVLDEGKIVGKGTHAELLANCDVYRQIASSQLSEKEIEASIAMHTENVKGDESHE
ncbi:ABC transporter ATP-binding protein [Anaerosporobacter faecicola]|uniref:ABC transporter ATP-binding protein n=1 Tax=Anaerosporobacter faecicola TaxID=2718714 RepID=UPI00143908BA|nr:ABC transporter ATP-binding protein [Anaerosporobacter faecicola]